MRFVGTEKTFFINKACEDMCMKSNRGEEIIYSINVNDLQEVSNDVLERRLTKREIASVEKCVGNYIDWFQAIEHAIRENVRE